MKISWLRWGCVTGIAAVVLGLALWLSASGPPYGTEADPFVLTRYVLLRLTAIAMATPALIGLMLLVDFVTPGEWMRAIGDDPKAASYLMSAVVLVIGALLCWV